MLYKVSKLYSRGTDIYIAEFQETNDAKMFIDVKLAEDSRLKVKVTYRLYEGLELLEEFTESTGQSGAAGASSAGASQTQRTSFQPTPFNTSPRPPGLPHAWLKDEDVKEEEGNR